MGQNDTLPKYIQAHHRNLFPPTAAHSHYAKVHHNPAEALAYDDISLMKCHAFPMTRFSATVVLEICMLLNVFDTLHAILGSGNERLWYHCVSGYACHSHLPYLTEAS